MIGTTLSHYRIVSRLGAGGMGEVYLAEDTRLERKVALKLLLPEFVSNRERMLRFIQEAKAAAALSHPNVAHIYEVGETDGTNFIAMEYVDGETLGMRMKPGRASLADLLKLLLQVAEGLAKAHSAGIVHRDLKPDNVMITRDGYAKILDFGLAKLIEAAPPKTDSTSNLTEQSTVVIQQPLSSAGTVMGTVGYMSPEQAQGKPIDQRSDIFSFGCILFEAATGRRPFDGDSTIDTLHKIIYSPAPPVTDLNPSAPTDLQRIVRRCLTKELDKRYQTIRDVANDLEECQRELATEGASANYLRTAAAEAYASTGDGATPPTSSAEYLIREIKQHKLASIVILVFVLAIGAGVSLYLHAANSEVAIESIAVLPFVNQNNDPETDYRSDGLTEGIINSLTQLPNLKVIARSSVFRYKGKDTDPLKAGKELGVRAVLTGRLAQRGDSLIVSAELLDVRDNKQLWGEQYSRKMADLLAVQRDIATEITNGLKLKLSGEQQVRVTKRFTDNPDAFQLYLQGRFYWNKRTGEGLKRSIDFFNQAVERDPNYALAYAGLADAYLLLPNYGVDSPTTSMPKAKAAAQTAIRLDDSLAEAHTSLASSLYNYDWNSAESIKEYKRAIELNPNYATAHQWYSDGPLLGSERFDEAIAEMKHAQELDPLSLIINAEIGVVYYFAGQYDKSIDQYRKTIELDPNFYFAHWNLGITYQTAGRFKEALAEYEIARQQNDDPMVFGLIGNLMAVTGSKDEARKALNVLSESSKRRYVAAYSFAQVHASLGENDQAFEWLEKAYRERAPDLCLFRIDPMMANLRGDPRFTDLVKRIGL